MTVKERLRTLIEHLNHGLVEREAAIKAALLAMLAGENMLLVGPPGTAKSLIARKLAKCLDEGADSQAGKEYFEYLLTKFTTPEEIFGPLSISELKQDRFKRNTAGYLPSVRVAFLDEIFKASSSILNALLTILNERTYHNGTEALDVPLQALIAASNELPTGQEELEALYDRFLVRSFVDYVRAENMPRLLEKTAPPPTQLKLTANDIEAIRQAAEEVQLTDDVIAALQRIWAEHKRMFKEDRREKLSDRRLKKAVHLLRISAASNGRSEVDLSDILLLKDCLWNHPDNANKVRQLVMDTLRSFSPAVPHNAELEAQREATLPTSLNPASEKAGVVVKGYKGSGTEHDPILVGTLDDLAGLEQAEVAQKGYWFKQTANIDCSKLKTWLQIDFQGHYDGGEYIIQHASTKPINLFGRVRNNSLLQNVRLSGLGLALNIDGSEVLACTSDRALLGDVTDCTVSFCESSDLLIRKAIKCTISHCRSGAALIGSYLADSTVQQCQTGHVLVDGDVSACVIQDCQVQVNGVWKINLQSSGTHVGGIARNLKGGSLVERCFVAGQLPRGEQVIHFSGIAASCDREVLSTIRQCALGEFMPGERVFLHESKRIAKHSPGGFLMIAALIPAMLEDNVALDCHRGESDANGPDGQSVSEVLFNKRLFEDRLGWNFKDVWLWNDQPELRSVGSKAMPIVTRYSELVSHGDLLSQQLSANIWL